MTEPMAESGGIDGLELGHAHSGSQEAESCVGPRKWLSRSLKSKNLLSSSEIWDLVQQQEGESEPVLGQLERQLRTVKSEEFKSSILSENPTKNPCDRAFIAAEYNCIYVSPIYEDSKNSMSHRKDQLDSQQELQSAASCEPRSDGSKNSQITRLKKQLTRLRQQESEVADKFVDKMNVINLPTTAKLRVYNNLKLQPTDQIANGPGQREMTEDVCEQKEALEGRHSLPGLNNFTSHASMKATPERLQGSRSLKDAKLPKDTNDSKQAITFFLATLQDSVENLDNSFKSCDAKDSASIIHNRAVEDELFILKSTLNKLAELCQESGFELFPSEKNAKESAPPVKICDEDADRTGEKCAESALEEARAEVEAQRHQVGELLSINEELLNFSQEKEHQVRDLQEKGKGLMQRIAEYEGAFMEFEWLVEEKETEIEELQRRLKASQIAADVLITEKIELMAQLQAAHKTEEERKARIEELAGINEQLLQLV